MSDELKSVAAEHYEREFPQTVIFARTFRIFGRLRFQQNKTGDFSKRNSSESKTSSYQALLGELKAVVFEKNEMEFRDHCKQKNYLCHFCPVEIPGST